MANIIQLLDSNTGESVNYEEVTTWYDNTLMDDSKIDNVIYRKKGEKYYSLTQFLAGHLIPVNRFGAKGDGITNDYIAFQKSLDTVGYIYMSQGKFLIDGTIRNNKFTEINKYYSNDGVQISGTTIIGNNRNKVSIINKNLNAPLFSLNGNPNNTATVQNPLAQTHNYIGGFTIVGGGDESTIFEINALWIANFEDMIIKDFGEAFKVLGSNPPDAATSNLLLFDRIFAQHGKSFFNSDIARTGSVKFSNSEFRYLSDVAIRGGFASLEINNCQISHCGNIQSNQSGGVDIITPSVQSINRAIKIENCLFEANRWSDIKVKNAHGISIMSNTFHPFWYLPIGSGNEQVCIRVEGDTTGVDGMVINANRISGMTNPPTGAEINRFLKITGNAKNINVDGLSAPVDSHLRYILDVSSNIENFNTGSFRVAAGWKIAGNTITESFTGDNTILDLRTVSQHIVRTYDQAGGIDGAGNYVGSRFNNQFAYIIPWTGVYQISGFVRLNLTDGREARVILQTERTIISTFHASQGTFSFTHRFQKGATVFLYLQVIGSVKNVGFLQSENDVMEFNIVQI